MPTISAEQIIGKTLFGKQPIPIRRSAADSAPIVYTVPKGQPVGTVFSWIDVNAAGNTVLNWSFKDSTGRSYYAKHQQGIFDFRALKDQGVLTTLEEIKEEQKKNEGILSFIERNIKTIGIIAAVALVLKESIPAFINRKK